jgi:DNA topoisomerase-3
MRDSRTQAPPLLSESDLITLMDKNQIGTDATIAQHIETIQKREYAVKKKNQFEPTELGLALVQGYNAMGFEGLAKPNLRAKMEADMLKICRGNITKQEVLQQNLEMYKGVFVNVTRKADQLFKV